MLMSFPATIRMKTFSTAPAQMIFFVQMSVQVDIKLTLAVILLATDSTLPSSFLFMDVFYVVEHVFPPLEGHFTNSTLVDLQRQYVHI